MHGGAIGFASKAGVGSTFAFYVKSRRSDPAVDLTTVLRSQLCNEKNKPRGSCTDTPGTEFADTNLHILIVEDNLVNQRVLAKQLRNIGMHVAVANHGGEALEYLRSTNYCVADGSGNRLSLILMD
jgi:PleD family two-component response regulator